MVALVQKIRGDGKLLVIANNTMEFPVSGRKTIFDHLLANAELNTPADVGRFRDLVNRTYFQERNGHRPEVTQINKRLAQLASKHHVLLLRKEDYLCDVEEEICFGATEKTEKAIRDYGHYTIAGARFFGERMAEIGWLKPLEDAARAARQEALNGDVQER
jgi:hypothetical protein